MTQRFGPTRAQRQARAAVSTRTYMAAQDRPGGALPAIYGGVAPTHTYDSVAELYELQRIESLLVDVAGAFGLMLRTFGPQPDMEIAWFEEDAGALRQRVQVRLDEVRAALEEKKP